MTRPRVLLIVSVALALIVAAIVTTLVTRARSHGETPPRVAAGPPSTAASGPRLLDAPLLERLGVRFAPMTRTEATHAIDVVGALDLNRERVAQVSSHAAGRAVAIDAVIGQRVSRGAVLAHVESPAVGEARAEYIVRRAEVHGARLNADRLEQLDARGLATARERELATTQLRTAQAGIEAASTRLRAFGVAPDGASARSGRAPLVAPIEGIVIRRDVLLGGWIQPEAEAFTIADLSTLWANLDVYESDLGRVAVGDTVSVDVPALGVTALIGQVQFVDPELDRTTRMGRVRVVVPNPEERLRAGLSVAGHIRPRVAYRAMRLPREATREREGRTEVLVRRGVEASWRTVRVGARAERDVEVVAGLDEGDLVAVAGLALVSGEP